MMSKLYKIIKPIIRILINKIAGNKVIGKDKVGNTYIELSTLSGANKNRREMIPYLDNDIDSMKSLHPLWKAWLQFKIDPPTDQEIDEYDLQLKRRIEIAKEYDQKELENEKRNVKPNNHDNNTKLL